MDDFVLVLRRMGGIVILGSQVLFLSFYELWSGNIYFYDLEVKNKDLKGNVARVIKYI